LHRDDRWRISIHAVGANAKGTLGVARSRTDISSCFTLQGLGDTVFSLCLLTSPGVDPPESRVLIREHGWRFDSSGFRVRTSVPGSAGKRIENYTLTAYLQQTYQSLLERGLLRTRIVPNCGYFTFAVPPAGTARTVMDQDYFELTGYPDHVRINLMLAEQYEDNAT